MIAKHIFFALAAIISADLAFSQPTKACSTAPRNFTINGFTTFTPSPENPQTEMLSFRVGNTSCSSATIFNSQTPKSCKNTAFDYLWNGTSLTVREMYTPCTDVSRRIQVSGEISHVSLYCYPVDSPYPLGHGTLCETPTGQVNGDFTRSTTLSS